ncbi:MAG: ATP-binding cassette domain-containing protein, partial [bacterium]
MIYFDKVTKKYPNKSVALEDITISVEPNEFVSIVGHSGAGKTTLLKMILG